MKQNDLTPSEYAQMLRQNGYVLVGSRYFFEGMPDFHPHDYDFVKVHAPGSTPISYHDHKNGCCINDLASGTIMDLLNYSRSADNDLIVCALFVPEIARQLGFKFLEMYEWLTPFVDRLRCTKWAYYGIIYDAYLTNGAMYLTDKQRQAAFEAYKKSKESII